jgi:hypothetical protein
MLKKTNCIWIKVLLGGEHGGQGKEESHEGVVFALSFEG